LNLEFNETDFESNPALFPEKLIGLAFLVTDPQAILRALDAQPWRMMVGSSEGAHISSADAQGRRA
jgi:hypothetical protein